MTVMFFCHNVMVMFFLSEHDGNVLSEHDINVLSEHDGNVLSEHEGNVLSEHDGNVLSEKNTFHSFSNMCRLTANSC